MSHAITTATSVNVARDPHDEIPSFNVEAYRAETEAMLRSSREFCARLDRNIAARTTSPATGLLAAFKLGQVLSDLPYEPSDEDVALLHADDASHDDEFCPEDLEMWTISDLDWRAGIEATMDEWDALDQASGLHWQGDVLRV